MFTKLKQLLKTGKIPEHGNDDASVPVAQKEEKKRDSDQVKEQGDSSVKKTDTGNSLPQKKNRKGIYRIESDKEMYDYFNSFDEDFDAEQKPKADQPQKRSSEKKVKHTRRNKHGLTILDKNDDLFSMMTDNGEDIDVPETGRGRSEESECQSNASIVRDKHGIPILSNSDDFRKAFSDDESFADSLERSLGGKTTDVLLREKRDNLDIRKPLTLKQKLKRYPLPQGQLDLHGYTSVKADLKAEAYLRQAYAGDIFTVRLIVGKGLHSEDGPVLPDVIEDRLVSLRKEKIVLTYEWDNRMKSKSGSVTVYLNNVFRK